MLLDALMILVIVVAGLLSHTTMAAARADRDRGRPNQQPAHQVHDLVPSAGQILAPTSGTW